MLFLPTPYFTPPNTLAPLHPLLHHFLSHGPSVNTTEACELLLLPLDPDEGAVEVAALLFIFLNYCHVIMKDLLFFQPRTACFGLF